MHSPIFAHSPIDRQGLRRRDDDFLAALPPETIRILPVFGQSVPVKDDSLAYFPVAGERIFLGMTGGLAYFAVSLAEAVDGLAFQDLRKVAGVLPAAEASLAAYAVGLVRWHERHGFCGVCGAPTLGAEAGHKRLCTNPACAAEHFPRTDPAVIVLVEHEDACLLARNGRHRPGMHSTLAGFVEPGESLEAAVEREIFEEAAVTLTDITYQASQPWPFPASLMVGFRATAASRDFTVDGLEIVAARWLTRAELAPYIDGPGDESFSLPSKLSISRQLIADWYYKVSP